MEKILEQFGVQPILLAAQAVNFLILLFILKKVLYRPILKVLAERKRRIAESLKNAQEIEKKLIQTEEEREKALAKAASEAQRILDEATKSAGLLVADAKQKATQEMEKIVKKGGESIKLEREKMFQEIRTELADLVVVSLEKVVGKALSQKDQKDLIEKSVKDLKI